MEGFEGWQTDQLQITGRSFVLRWHPIFRRRRGLHRTTTDGSGTPFGYRGRISNRPWKRGNQHFFSHSDFYYVSRSGGGTGPAVRSGSRSLRPFAKKRNGGARTLHGGRLQTRRGGPFKTQSELLEDRCSGA